MTTSFGKISAVLLTSAALACGAGVAQWRPELK